MAENDEFKVRFRLDQVDRRGLKTESLWAEPVAPYQFRLRNSPFYAFGISSEDIVQAKDVDGFLEFDGVVSRGGHSTFRIFLQEGRTIQEDDFRSFWEPIAALGATFENANDHFIAIGIPPGKNVAEIYRLLDVGEEAGIWAFEEVHCEPQFDPPGNRADA